MWYSDLRTPDMNDYMLFNNKEKKKKKKKNPPQKNLKSLNPQKDGGS